jgi:hypothetical protein
MADQRRAWLSKQAAGNKTNCRSALHSDGLQSRCSEVCTSVTQDANGRAILLPDVSSCLPHALLHVGGLILQFKLVQFELLAARCLRDKPSHAYATR